MFFNKYMKWLTYYRHYKYFSLWICGRNLKCILYCRSQKNDYEARDRSNSSLTNQCSLWFWESIGFYLLSIRSYLHHINSISMNNKENTVFNSLLIRCFFLLFNGYGLRHLRCRPCPERNARDLLPQLWDETSYHSFGISRTELLMWRNF